jgi:hypothetical protein
VSQQPLLHITSTDELEGQDVRNMQRLCSQLELIYLISTEDEEAADMRWSLRFGPLRVKKRGLLLFSNAYKVENASETGSQMNL